MPLTTKPLPYGLRDVKLSPYAGAVLGTAVDLPAARTLSFSEAEDFQDLRGDDGIVTTRGSGPTVDWELEGGGISFEAWKVLSGATITEDGTTPTQTKTLRKKSTESRPFFKAEGQAISDSGGDFHVVLYRCRATGELSGELSDGNFWLSGASGKALPATVPSLADPEVDEDNVLYDFVQNESETAI